MQLIFNIDSNPLSEYPIDIDSEYFPKDTLFHMLIRNSAISNRKVFIYTYKTTCNEELKYITLFVKTLHDISLNGGNMNFIFRELFITKEGQKLLRIYGRYFLLTEFTLSDPNQDLHVENLETYYKSNIHPFTLDKSPMGSGKSYTTIKLYKKLKLPHIFIICPPNGVEKWDSICRQFQVRATVVSYHKLTVGKNKYITKRKLEDGSYKYTPSGHLTRLLSEGTFLVFDEIQIGKKKSTCMYKMIKSITSDIFKYNRTLTKGIFLSTTPYSTMNEMLNISKLMGYIKDADILCVKDKTRRYKTENILYIHKIVHKLYDKHTLEIHSPILVGYKLKKWSDVAYKIKWLYYDYVRLVMDKTFRMNHGGNEVVKEITWNPLKLKYKKEYFNNTDIGDYEVKNNVHGILYHDISMFTRIRIRLNQLKCNLIQHTIHKHLLTSTNSKIILVMNYKTSLLSLSDSLSEWNPLILDGNTRKSHKNTIITKFNTRSLEHRVLICNFATINGGIDLDDKCGKFPRTMYIIPNYDVISMIQCTGRIYRLDTLSVPTIRFVTFDNLENDISLLKVLNDKIRFMSLTIHPSIETQINVN